MKLKAIVWGLALMFLAGTSALSAADFVVIANSDAGVTALAKEDLKNILLGNKTKWDNGSLIKLAIQAGGGAHEKLIPDVTARSVDQYEKFLKKQVFTGKGVMPEVLKSDAEMLAYVSKTPGALGYVSAGSDTGATKVLTIN